MLDVADIIEAHASHGRESTHWEDCHLAHPRCAILALAHEVHRLRDELDRAHDAPHVYSEHHPACLKGDGP